MKTVYIDGTFDLLHTGHVKLLKKRVNSVSCPFKNNPNKMMIIGGNVKQCEVFDCNIHKSTKAHNIKWDRAYPGILSQSDCVIVGMLS